MIAIVASPVTIKATRRQHTAVHDQFHMVLSLQRLRILHRPILLLVVVVVAGRLACGVADVELMLHYFHV